MSSSSTRPTGLAWSRRSRRSRHAVAAPVAARPPIFRTVATEGTGVAELLDELDGAPKRTRARARSAMADRSSRHRGAIVWPSACRSIAEQLAMPVLGAETVAQKRCSVAMLPAGAVADRTAGAAAPEIPDREVSGEARPGHCTTSRCACRPAGGGRTTAERRARAAGRAAARGGRTPLCFRASGQRRWRTMGTYSGVMRSEFAKIGIIGGSGLYSMPGFTEQKEVDDRDAVRRAVGQLHRRATGRAGSRVSGAPRPRPSHLAFGAEFSRQHLRHEDAGRGAHPFAERRRIAQGRTPAARFRDSRSVLRSHARPHLHVLRRRSGGAHQLCRSGLSAAFGHRGTRRAARRASM